MAENNINNSSNSSISNINNIIEVENLTKYFPIKAGVFQHTVGHVRAVDDVSFSIPYGKTMGLVGESGCGKTTVGRTILRLYEPTSGAVKFDGRNVAGIPKSRLRKLRAGSSRPMRRRLPIASKYR